MVSGKAIHALGLPLEHEGGGGTLALSVYDVLGSRSLNIVYRNTYGYPISVIVSVLCERNVGSGSNKALVVCAIGPAPIPVFSLGTFGLAPKASSPIEAMYNCIHFIVPNLWYYRVGSMVTNGTVTIDAWTEVTWEIV